MNLSKTKYQLFATILLGLMVLAWIGFLFLDAKKTKTSEVNQTFEAFLQEEETGQISQENADIKHLLDQQEQKLSLEDLDQLSSLKEKITLLEKQIEEDPSFELKKLLLDAYVLEQRFPQASQLFSTFSPDEKSQLSPQLPFLIAFNSFSQTDPQAYQDLLASFQKGKENWVFSAEELGYYELVFALVEHQYEQAQNLIPQLETTQYSGFAQAISSIFQQSKSLKDVPAYYQEGLIAFQLMQNGALALAKKSAIPLVNDYPHYILPQQILAYVDFTFGYKEAALASFQALLEKDYAQKNNYLYYLGLLNFQLENYKDAVLYFTQITDQSLMFDAERYLVLSYLQLGEEEKTFKAWQRLLGYPHLKKSDFYSFFQENLRNPYLRGASPRILQKEKKLLESYLSLCKKKLEKADQVVCAYGELGLQVHQAENKTDLRLSARRLMKEYQNAGFYLVIADAMLEVKEYEAAIAELLKALQLTHQAKARSYLKYRILQAKQALEA